MKLLTAVIAPSRVEHVTAALDGAGLTATTVATAQASGLTGGRSQKYKGVEYRDQRCVRLEVLVADDDLAVAVDLVTTAGDQGPDDVVVWVSDVDGVSTRQHLVGAGVRVAHG